MSLGKEIGTDIEIDSFIRYFRRKRMIEDNLWMTNDGKIIKIENMTTNHIINCLNFLRNKPGDIAEMYYDLFSKELKRRRG